MAAIPEDARALGAWLAEQRETANLTQAELAQAAGVATRTIQRWEGGTHAPIDVIRVLTALGVKMTPSAPEKVRALNAAVSDVAELIGNLDQMYEKIKAAEESDLAGRLELLAASVDQMAGRTAESLSRLEAEIARLSDQQQPPAGQTRKKAAQ